jgi:hypothetical protein
MITMVSQFNNADSTVLSTTDIPGLPTGYSHI